jgi:hypothetical protein
MRAKEFVFEDDGQKIPKSQLNVVPGMKTHPKLDNSSPYAPWRFAALYLGGAGTGEYEHDPTPDGPIGQALTTVAYSDGDKKIIDQAEKKFGAKSKQISPNGSIEDPTAHKVSPVTGFKGFNLKSHKKAKNKK